MEASCVMDWILPAGVVLLLLLFVYLYGTWTFSAFSDLSIPGPKPVPFFGNMSEVRKKGFIACLLEWKKKYGNNFGLSVWDTSCLPVCFLITLNDLHLFEESTLCGTQCSDPDIAKEVFIKDFNNFVNRSDLPRRLIPNKLKNNIASAKDNTWRRLRHTLTPTFSPGKLKQAGPYIKRCCENLSCAVEKETEKAQLIDVKKVFGAFTIDVIVGTGFGMETDFVGGENDAFLQTAIAVLRGGTTLGWSSAFITLFPWFSGVLQLLKNDISNNVLKMHSFVNQLIEDRKKKREASQVDLLQLMLDAEATEADITARPQDRQMTRDEIITQSITFMLAGYDTTATTLQYMIYLLALNPDKQEKLYNEIVSCIGDASPNYENVMDIKYLDNSVWETTRCFPPFALIGRRAAKTRTIKGVTIKAKSCVGVSVCDIMHDKEIFHEPHKFIPERFDHEDIPVFLRELPFGVGPRQCIGMRLALYEIKMAAVTIIRQFKFTKVPETPEMITFNTSALSSTPLKTLVVGAERRK